MKTPCSFPLRQLFTGSVALCTLAPASYSQDPPDLKLHLAGGIPQLSLTGATGAVCQIQYVNSLAASNHWLCLTNLSITSGLSWVQDAEGLIQTQRFYRAMAFPPSLALIPAGPFEMGVTNSEGFTNELPAHTVSVSAFLLERREVTKELWDSVYTWATNHGYEFDHAGSGKAPDHPVQTVNWFDAVKWCNARSEMEGLTPAYYLDTSFTTVYREAAQAALWTNFVKWDANGYRLPTEAEWEKAARGGLPGLRFPWGDTITHTQANYYSSATYAYDVSATRNYNTNFSINGFPYTNPTDFFAPNAYGLFGMADNVGEWCWDWYDAGWYSKAAATNVNCRGPRGDGMTYRVRRGGSWNVYANKARTAFRDYGSPGDATVSFGFRCARGL